MTAQRCPWVPSGGTSHAEQSGVAPPAIEAKLPCTSRVDPNPITGEPSKVVVTDCSSSWARRSLLCWLSNRSCTIVPRGLTTTAASATMTAEATAMRDAGRPLAAWMTTTRITPRTREAHSPRLSEYTVGTAATMRTKGAATRWARVPLRIQATMKNGRLNARLAPQELAKAKGAFGRASGRPRTIWTSATPGWMSDLTKEFDVSPRGSTSSRADRSSKVGTSTRSSPPAAVMTNIHAKTDGSYSKGITRRLALATHSRTIVHTRYQLRR